MAEPVKFIYKQFDDAFAVWFGQSKSFLLLAEPAFEVLQLYSAGKGKRKITTICKTKYGHLENNISQFVHEIIEHIHFFNNPENWKVLSQKTKVNTVTCPEYLLPPIHYSIGGKIMTVSYGNEYLKFAIHPLIAHLETNEPVESGHEFECFEHDGFYLVKYNGQLAEAFKKEHIEYFTGSVKQLMYSILFEIDYYHWMSMLHASGIVMNKQAVLFSAAAGSGKSTISAILKAQGFGYLSDDFIAVDLHGKAYPFPAAISVKEGAVEALSAYFPELADQQTKQSFVGKQVRYLPVFNVDEHTKGVTVKAFVFVQYSKSEPFNFEEVTKKKALELLLQETWVNPTPELVTAFFEWIGKTYFYRLTYSDNEKMISTIKNIFGNDE